MKLVPVDYTTFWSLVASKSLLAQYTEAVDFYYLFAVEDSISWEVTIAKDGGANQTDFETNHKSSCNQPLEFRSEDGLLKTASAMFVDNLGYWVEGTNGTLTITASTSGYLRTNFSTNYQLNGVDIHWAGANLGDAVNFEIGVYTNNDTSSESNFVQLAQFANNYRVLNEGTKTFDVNTVKTVPPTYDGLTVYIRTTYINVGPSTATLCVNLLGYK